MPTPPYLVLLRAGFCLPPTLPPARCALTAPFHPYPSLGALAPRSRAGSAAEFVCAGLPRASHERDPSREAVCFLCHCPSSCPARALPGALPFGVRTFLPPSPFGLRREARCSPRTTRCTPAHQGAKTGDRLADCDRSIIAYWPEALPTARLERVPCLQRPNRKCSRSSGSDSWTPQLSVHFLLDSVLLELLV